MVGWKWRKLFWIHLLPPLFDSFLFLLSCEFSYFLCGRDLRTTSWWFMMLGRGKTSLGCFPSKSTPRAYLILWNPWVLPSLSFSVNTPFWKEVFNSWWIPNLFEEILWDYLHHVLVKVWTKFHNFLEMIWSSFGFLEKVSKNLWKQGPLIFILGTRFLRLVIFREIL